MTARSHLLAIPFCRILRDLRARHPDYGDYWGGAIRHHAEAFLRHYRRVVSRLSDGSGRPAPADAQHLREIAQLRLTYALVLGENRVDIDPENTDDVVAADACLSSPVIDIDDHATWLRDHGRADGNIIASITCPAYVDALDGLDRSYEDLVGSYPWLPRECRQVDGSPIPRFSPLREGEKQQGR